MNIDNTYLQKEFGLAVPYEELSRLKSQLNDLEKGNLNSKKLSEITTEVKAWRDNPGKERIKNALYGLACLVLAAAAVALTYFFGPIPAIGLAFASGPKSGFELGIVLYSFAFPCAAIFALIKSGKFFVKSLSKNYLSKIEKKEQDLTKELGIEKEKCKTRIQEIEKVACEVLDKIKERNQLYQTHESDPIIKQVLAEKIRLNTDQMTLIEKIFGQSKICLAASAPAS